MNLAGPDGWAAVVHGGWDLIPLLRHEGAVVELVVRREGGGDERTVSLNLRRLI